jgi:hypothetical protein
VAEAAPASAMFLKAGTRLASGSNEDSLIEESLFGSISFSLLNSVLARIAPLFLESFHTTRSTERIRIG